MKIGDTKLKLSSGKILKFRSKKARDKFEKVAWAIKKNPKFKNKLKKRVRRKG